MLSLTVAGSNVYIIVFFQSCLSGYYQILSSNGYSKECRPCPCNGNEESCFLDSTSRVVCKCKPGHGGSSCEGKLLLYSRARSPILNNVLKGHVSVKIVAVREIYISPIFGLEMQEINSGVFPEINFDRGGGGYNIFALHSYPPQVDIQKFK